MPSFKQNRPVVFGWRGVFLCPKSGLVYIHLPVKLDIQTPRKGQGNEDQKKTARHRPPASTIQLEGTMNAERRRTPLGLDPIDPKLIAGLRGVAERARQNMRRFDSLPIKDQERIVLEVQKQENADFAQRFLREKEARELADWLIVGNKLNEPEYALATAIIEAGWRKHGA